MGNQLPVQYQVIRPLGEAWQQVVLNPRVSDSINYILLRNVETKEEAQEYLLNLPSHDVEEELRRYNLRYLQDLQLVTVKHVEVIEGGACSGIKNRLIVVTERILHSLAEHPGLNQEQARSVLLKALIGFKAIYEFEGYTPVNGKLILFNQHNDVKVWMNEDLAVNHPRVRSSGVRPTGTEAQMVGEVIDTVELYAKNQKQFSLIKRLMIADGELSFERALLVMNSKTVKERGVSPIALLSGLSPRTEDVIRQIESQGLKVINTREAKRYVEEPGRVVYKQVQEPHNSILYTPSVKNVAPQMKPNKNLDNVRSTGLLNPSPVRYNQSPAKSHANSLTKNTSSSRVIVSSPQRVLTNQIPIRSHNVLPSIHSPTRRPSKEMANQRISPLQPRQTIYLSPATHRSPSPRNSINSIRQQVVTSASPYFKHPSYVVHQPIIRCKNNGDISKISRVSVNSRGSSQSHKQRIIPPTIIYSKVQSELEPSVLPKHELFQSQELMNQQSGFAKESIGSSHLSPLRKMPSIEREIQSLEQTSSLSDNNKDAEQVLVQVQKQTKPSVIPHPKDKVEWIKVSPKTQTPILSKHGSKSSYSNPTQVPNSPVTTKDIMISYDQPLFNPLLHGNKFSMADLMKQSPTEQHEIQLPSPQTQDPNSNSRVQSSNHSNISKKKLVIYTDVATIHCDDAIIEKGNEAYRITVEDPERQKSEKSQHKE